MVTTCTTRFDIKIFFLSTHCIYVLFGSQNKQRLLPRTALIYWFLKPKQNMFTTRYELIL